MEEFEKVYDPERNVMVVRPKGSTAAKWYRPGERVPVSDAVAWAAAPRDLTRDEAIAQIVDDYLGRIDTFAKLTDEGRAQLRQLALRHATESIERVERDAMEFLNTGTWGTR